MPNTTSNFDILIDPKDERTKKMVTTGASWLVS